MRFDVSILFVAILFSICSLSAQIINDCGKVTDIDGNEYSTILLGKQCWLKENLRTTRYPDGKNIIPTPKFPNNSLENIEKFGRLYTWQSILDNAEPTEETDGRVQGICPTGWHIPSNFEWMNLEDFVGYNDNYRCGTDVNYVAKSLATSDVWKSSSEEFINPCAVANNPTANNATNFSVFPTGGVMNGNCFGFGEEAGFWTCSNGSEETAPIHFFYYLNATIEINCTPKEAFYSVRCVKNQ